VFLLGGWGWCICVAAGLGAHVWEAAIEQRAPMWYRTWVQGRHGSGLVATSVLVLLFVWPLVRYRGRERAIAEPILGLTWVALTAWLGALVWVSVA
jgi:hypothetical protein